jgi:DNA-binding beta-propeller fold protein YncE
VKSTPRQVAPRSRLAGALAVLALLAGCGSTPAADLPAPAGPGVSPRLSAQPAGTVTAGRFAPPPGPLTLDRSRDTLTVAGRTTRTCREPVAASAVDDGRRIAVLCGRARVLDVYEGATLRRIGRTPAGIGPAGLATDTGSLLYVTDRVGQALLVFHLRPRFELIRRVSLAGGPYAIAYDPDGWALWITLTERNRVIEYAAGNRPVPRRSFPSVRAPRAVTVAPGRVSVYGPDARQVLRVRAR